MPRVVQKTAELRRILALPRRAQVHDEELAVRLSENLRRPEGKQTLRSIQAMALFEGWRAGGLFAPIGVGEGKTLITLLAPLVAKAKAPILLLPAKLREKTQRELQEIGRDWKIANHIRIYSYEKLGRDDHKDLLDRYPPCDMLIADEVHKLRNLKSAVTRRVRRFLESRNIPFWALSGSITKRSIRDYAHLIRWALKEGSPLPHVFGEVEDWADALDQHDHERPEPGALVIFSDGDSDLTEVRKGYQRRLVETPGVVSSIRNRISASLFLRGVRYPRSEKTIAAMNAFRSTWALPDGTLHSLGLDMWRHMRELALGYWSRWDPEPPKEWLEPRREWMSRCREILSRSHTYDSELSVKRAIDAGDRREALAGADRILAAWRDVEDTFTPNPVPVWIDDQPLIFAEEWGKKNQGVIFTEHVPFAKALQDRTGWAYYGQTGLDTRTGKLVDKHGPTTCVASRQSCTEGFNLQHQWSKALITAILANGTQTEQTLGRLHRPGQEEDVEFDMMIGCPEHVDSFWKAKKDAEYNHETTGVEDKILYADTDFPARF